MLLRLLLLFFLHFWYQFARIEHLDSKLSSLANYLDPLLVADGVANPCRIAFRIKLRQLGRIMNNVISIS
jgi:DUF1365 family protein